MTKELAIRLYIASNRRDSYDWVEMLLDFYPEVAKLTPEEKTEALKLYQNLKNGSAKLLTINTPIEISEKDVERICTGISKKLQLENIVGYQIVNKENTQIVLQIDDKQILIDNKLTDID